MISADLFATVARSLLLPVTIILVAGCDTSASGSDSKETVASEALQSVGVDTPYSFWVTEATMTANELSLSLAENPSYGDEICNADSAKPVGYRTTFALISTHEYNRSDLLDRYDMDPDQAVAAGDTNIVLADHLGDFVAQSANLRFPDDRVKTAATETIKITFSRQGKFTGYCHATRGYFVSVHADVKTGQMGLYAVSCDNPDATLACLSVR
ncbi:MAG: hypothetical protein KDI36_03480 [Pseudomonadales bacterium]|nr:hypothetical protein [Pseudomonadales bacterium]